MFWSFCHGPKTPSVACVFYFVLICTCFWLNVNIYTFFLAISLYNTRTHSSSHAARICHKEWIHARKYAVHLSFLQRLSRCFFFLRCSEVRVYRAVPHPVGFSERKTRTARHRTILEDYDRHRTARFDSQRKRRRERGRFLSHVALRCDAVRFLSVFIVFSRFVPNRTERHRMKTQKPKSTVSWNCTVLASFSVKTRSGPFISSRQLRRTQ